MSERISSFRDLKVYRAAFELQQEIFEITKTYPREEQYSLTDQKGFSARNLKYMRKFAESYPDREIVQQAAAQIPWFHNCTILDKVQDAEQREWYIRAIRKVVSEEAKKD